MKKIVIICPVFNEEEVIPLFIEEIKKVEAKISEKYSLDLVFSNNASTDKTYEIIKEYSNTYNNIYYLTLSKNFGYQKSLNFSLKNTNGDLYSIIDVDGEDPPSMILEFLKKYEQGNDIVYGLRENRPENFFIKKMRNFFYRVLKFSSDDEIILKMAEFSLFTNEIKQHLIEENTSFPFLRSSISRLGFDSAAIPYTRLKRLAGKSNYNIFSMIKFAVAGILASTTLPLRLPIYFFPIWFFISVLLLANHSSDPFYWNYLIYISILYIVVTISFISIYVARIYQNGLMRANAYLVKKKSKTQ
jgi:glycosyltransferase involved in cell wall biosynthesis|tara:strand:+ start:330 stop:1235 length:906 start_codon:yes stop_codon:yes gene_type:complete